MAFVSAHPYRPDAFADLPLGAVFRFDGLAAHQICIKAQGAAKDEAWTLLLGGGTGGRFPSPWFGPMSDVRDAAVSRFDAALTVAPTGPPVSLDTPLAVQPGDLIARGGGRYGVFIGDGACIDLDTGRRVKIEVRSDRAFASWALYYGGAPQRRLFQYPVPEGVAP
jgi:hypothetical protein